MGRRKRLSLKDFVKPLTDEQVFYDTFYYDKFTLPSVGVYTQQFFMTSLSLTSLNVVGSLHKVYYTPLTNVLLGSIYFDKFSLLTIHTKKF